MDHFTRDISSLSEISLKIWIRIWYSYFNLAGTTTLKSKTSNAPYFLCYSSILRWRRCLILFRVNAKHPFNQEEWRLRLWNKTVQGFLVALRYFRGEIRRMKIRYYISWDIIKTNVNSSVNKQKYRKNHFPLCQAHRPNVAKKKIFKRWNNIHGTEQQKSLCPLNGFVSSFRGWGWGTG